MLVAEPNHGGARDPVHAVLAGRGEQRHPRLAHLRVALLVQAGSLPHAVALIAPEMLTVAERSWFDAYHRTVREALSPHLERDLVRWLEAQTRPLAHDAESGPMAEDR